MSGSEERLGTLECTLSRAENLKDVDLLGDQDPYAVVKCGTKTYRSRTDTDGGKDPTWNESFAFHNVSPHLRIKVEFFDENIVFRDVSIGVAIIDLTEVYANGSGEVVAPVLTQKSKHRGHVYMNFKWIPGLTAQPSPKGGALLELASKSKQGNWILATYGGTSAWTDYTPGEILGKGTFGTTYLAKHKTTGELVAIKVISKRKLNSAEEVADVQHEVQIMHHLKGHPNIVALRGAYEDNQDVCLVMDVCSGGELFDAIVKRGRYTEKDAAMLIRTIVSAIAHCHEMGVMHRDLKPENFLLSDKTPQAQIKATDFGLSSFFHEGQLFTDIVGSAFYVAPEVLRRKAGKESDIWSCGVILYIMLCGFPPFFGKNEKEIFECILSKKPDFNVNPWPRISEPAKDCVRKMLEPNPKLRATANEILQHEWMRENGVASDKVIELEVLARIRKFSAMNRLKKEALKVIAKNLPLDEITGMRGIFAEIDKDKSGTITLNEFTAALRKKGSMLPEAELNRILQAADVDGDGTMDYQEFLAATINLSKLERDEHLRTAFAHFDLDGNGRITRDELTTALSNLGINNVKQIIDDVDKDGSGDIDYKEFCEMMRQ